MRNQFTEALDSIKQDVLKMGTLCEENMRKAITSLMNKDKDLAEDVINSDSEINNMEVDLEDKIAKMIATMQPVASDLRTLITSMKIIGQLERIGDHAVHIAKDTIRLFGNEYLPPFQDLPRMGDIGLKMLNFVLSAFIEENAEEAEKIAMMDDAIDELNTKVAEEAVRIAGETPEHFRISIELILISRYLERFGDHVTNICEWVVFNVTGEHKELNS